MNNLPSPPRHAVTALRRPIQQRPPPKQRRAYDRSALRHCSCVLPRLRYAVQYNCFTPAPRRRGYDSGDLRHLRHLRYVLPRRRCAARYNGSKPLDSAEDLTVASSTISATLCRNGAMPLHTTAPPYRQRCEYDNGDLRRRQSYLRRTLPRRRCAARYFSSTYFESFTCSCDYAGGWTLPRYDLVRCTGCNPSLYAAS